jgi:hypothetical protein
MEPSEELQRYCRLPGHAGRGLSRSCAVAGLRRQHATTAADEAGVGDASPPVRGQPSLRPGSGVMTLRGRLVTPSTGGAVLSSDDYGTRVGRKGDDQVLWRWSSQVNKTLARTQVRDASERKQLGRRLLAWIQQLEGRPWRSQTQSWRRPPPAEEPRSPKVESLPLRQTGQSLATQ